MNSPTRVLFHQLTFRIHHFRLYPNTKLNSCLFGVTYQCRNTSRKFLTVSFPVTKTSIITITRIFVTKPSVIKQEHVNAQIFRLLHQFGQCRLIKVECSILPIVEQRHTSTFSILQLVIACPALEITAALTCTFTQGKNKFWSCKHFPFRQFIHRSIRIYRRNNPQIAHIVNFECEAEIACPSDGSH